MIGFLANLGGVVPSIFQVTLFAPLFYVIIYKVIGKQRKKVSMTYVEKISSGGKEDE